MGVAWEAGCGCLDDFVIGLLFGRCVLCRAWGLHGMLFSCMFCLVFLGLCEFCWFVVVCSLKSCGLV